MTDPDAIVIGSGSGRAWPPPALSPTPAARSRCSRRAPRLGGRILTVHDRGVAARRWSWARSSSTARREAARAIADARRASPSWRCPTSTSGPSAAGCARWARSGLASRKVLRRDRHSEGRTCPWRAPSPARRIPAPRASARRIFVEGYHAAHLDRVSAQSLASARGGHGRAAKAVPARATATPAIAGMAADRSRPASAASAHGLHSSSEGPLAARHGRGRLSLRRRRAGRIGPGAPRRHHAPARRAARRAEASPARSGSSRCRRR